MIFAISIYVVLAIIDFVYLLKIGIRLYKKNCTVYFIDVILAIAVIVTLSVLFPLHLLIKVLTIKLK